MSVDLASQTEDRDGLLWPKGDRDTYPTVKAELAEIPEILALIQRRGVVVQAGGNAGLWPRDLAQHFGHVYTFEPDPLSFRCLVANNPFPNVTPINAALGMQPGLVAIDRWLGPANHGANRIAKAPQAPRIPTLTIDALGLQECDLIQLDIEGYELNALKGASETIARCKPVIVVELRNHAHHYGTSDVAIREWIVGQGYRRAWTKNYDEAFIPA
jgi:FkbM family methyltransferase